MTHDDALLASSAMPRASCVPPTICFRLPRWFRGKALPTIAAVSRLLLETRDEAETEDAHRIRGEAD